MKRFVDFKCWKNAKHPIEVSTFGSEAAAIGAALLFSDKSIKTLWKANHLSLFGSDTR